MYEKMTHILEELRATAYSTVCPHGRPVMLRLTRREMRRTSIGSDAAASVGLRTEVSAASRGLYDLGVLEC